MGMFSSNVMLIGGGGGGGSYSRQIAADVDDGWVLGTTFWSATGSEIIIGDGAGTPQTGGIWFDGLPEGKTLTDARLEFTTLATGGSAGVDATMRIWAEDADDPGIFTNTGGNRPTDVVRTASSATQALVASTAYSIDITTVMQIIMDRTRNDGEACRFELQAVSIIKNHSIEIADINNGASFTLTMDW